MDALVPYGPKVEQGAREATDQAIALLAARYPDVAFTSGADILDTPDGRTLIVLTVVAHGGWSRDLYSAMPVTPEALAAADSLIANRCADMLADKLTEVIDRERSHSPR